MSVSISMARNHIVPKGDKDLLAYWLSEELAGTDTAIVPDGDGLRIVDAEFEDCWPVESINCRAASAIEGIMGLDRVGAGSFFEYFNEEEHQFERLEKMPDGTVADMAAPIESPWA